MKWKSSLCPGARLGGLALVLAAGALWLSCSGETLDAPSSPDVPGVVGTGIGLCDSDPCIVVYVSERTPEVGRAIPAEVEGHRVRIEETGPIRALEP